MRVRLNVNVSTVWDMRLICKMFFKTQFRSCILACLFILTTIYVYVVFYVADPNPNNEVQTDQDESDENSASISRTSINVDSWTQFDNANGTVLSFRKEFKYPMNVKVSKLVKQYKQSGNLSVFPKYRYGYDFIIRPNFTCSRQNRSMLFLIKSAVRNFRCRQAIRETWGNEHNHKDLSIKIVFLIGHSNFQRQNADIQKESARYQDILSASFLDAYYNNTLKLIGGLKWMSETCSDTDYVVIADDDYYFAPNLIWQHLLHLPKVQKKLLFLGNEGNRHVQRDLRDKWYVSTEEWPYDMYPPYLLAGAIIISPSFAKDLYIATMYTKPFKFDDVYMGILCGKLGVVPQSNINFVTGTAGALLKQYYKFRSTLAAHGFRSPDMLHKAWKLHNEMFKYQL